MTFKERKDLPVYNPDVRVWEVFDADGKSLALYYGDYFQRAQQERRRVGRQLRGPVVPSRHETRSSSTYSTSPSRRRGSRRCLSFDDVGALFHEFGHALHGMLLERQVPDARGHTPRDFVEFPSQFNEHWALEPGGLRAIYAQALQDRRADARRRWSTRSRRPSTFNQGYMTTEYLAAALLDMAWHTLSGRRAAPDVDAFEKAALRRFHVDCAQVPPRYRTTYFSHIWGGGYSAGYYAYLWSGADRRRRVLLVPGARRA